MSNPDTNEITMTFVEASWKKEINDIREEFQATMDWIALPRNISPELNLHNITVGRPMSKEEEDDMRRKLNIVFYFRLREFWRKENNQLATDKKGTSTTSYTARKI